MNCADVDAIMTAYVDGEAAPADAAAVRAHLDGCPHCRARAAEERTIGKLTTAGADRVMSPYQLAGRRIASVLLRPSIVDFLDVVVGEGEAAMRLEQFHVGGGSPLVGRRLKETDIGQRTGAIVVGIHGSDGKPRGDPAASAGISGVTIHQDDVLIALGSDGQLNRLKDMAG